MSHEEQNEWKRQQDAERAKLEAERFAALSPEEQERHDTALWVEFWGD